MQYIGCDFHPSFQVIAQLDKKTGELVRRRLGHGEGQGEVQRFYQALPGSWVVGVEATGSTYWFERLLEKLGHQMWMGDAAKIRQQDGRKQKHDKRDARLILRLLLEERFPQIWIPSVGGTGSAAVVAASLAPGADAGADQEPAAAHCLEPGFAEEKQAVEQGGAGAVAEAGVGTLGTAASRRTAGDAGADGRVDRATGSSSGAGSRGPAPDKSAADASGSRPCDGTGDGAHHGGSGTLPGFAQLDQLSGIESFRELQWREALVGQDQQTRKPVFTSSSGGRGKQCRPRRQRSGPRVRAPKGPEAPRRGQSSSGAEAGGAVVLDGAYREVLSSGRSHAGEPESSRGQQPWPRR
jgi:hypothetical protein